MTKSKTFKEWIQFYELKTGDVAEIKPGSHLLYHAERGYAVVRTDDDGRMIIVDEACGDGKFWHDILEVAADGLGYDFICTRITRNVEAYIRAFGWTTEKKYLYIHPKSVSVEDRYLARDSQGRPIVITFSSYDDKGKKIYWGTHYLRTTEAPKLEVSPEAVDMMGDEVNPKGEE